MNQSSHRTLFERIKDHRYKWGYMVFPSHLNQTLVEFLTNWHILKSRISMERNKIFENSIFHLEETICIYLK